MSSYLPVSGIAGIVVFTDFNGTSHTLCADSYQYHAWANIHEAPSFCGIQDINRNSSYMNHAPGMKRGGATISGSWSQGDNLFLDGLKLNALGALSLTITGSGSAASFSGCTVIVADWQVNDDSDGMARWTCTFIFDGPFPDFANSFA